MPTPLLGGLPETEDLVKWLQSQKQPARLASRAGGVSPSFRTNIGGVRTRMAPIDPQLQEAAATIRPRVSPQQAESAAASFAGSGAGFFKRALSGLGTAATLIPAAYQIGKSLNENILKNRGYTDYDIEHGKVPPGLMALMLGDKPNSRLPSMEDMNLAALGVNNGSSDSSTKPSPLPLLPPPNETKLLRTPISDTPPTVSFIPPELYSAEKDEVPEKPASQEESDIPPEMKVEAQTDPYLELATQLLSMPDRQAPTSQPSPESVQTLQSLSKNKTELPSKPTSTFGKIGRGIKKFIVAGSGPVDFTRLDRQEAGQYQAENALTDREKLAAEGAMADVAGARGLTRQGKLAQFQQPLSPQTQFMLDLIGGNMRGETAHKNRVKEMGIEHGYRSNEIGQQGEQRLKEVSASGAAQKVTPESLRQQSLYKIAEQYLDPEVLNELGIKVSPASIEAARTHLTKDNPMSEVLAQLLKERMRGINGGNAPLLNTSALAPKR